MDRKPVQKPSGHPVSDDRGNATWEWSRDGELDTAGLEALTEGLAVEEATAKEGQAKGAGPDPYNKRVGAAAPAAENESKPRTLDDMRRLSEEIKRKREEHKG
jgi:hypothetical protein